MVTWVDGPRELNSLLGTKRFFLTIIEINPNDDKNMMVRVRCDCGTEKIIKLASLRLDTKSCGCKKSDLLLKVHRKHGHASGDKYSSTYQRWQGMKQRCLNQNSLEFHRYGDRGIKICDRWLHSFENFLADMGNAPDGAYIDRINNDGNYEPSNCRWVSSKESASNRSTNRRIMLDGLFLTVTQHAERIGVSPACITAREKAGTLREKWSECNVKIGRPKWKNIIAQKP